MALPIRTASAATLLFCAAACTPQPAATGIAPVSVAGARPAPVPLPATLRLPPGPGPHPVVILLHGCGGISPVMGMWADRIASWGYGSVVVDSLTPRGVRSVCAPGRQNLVNRFDRAGDVVATARWLQTQPGVDGRHLAVLGLSHGGGTAVTVTLHPYADAVAGKVVASIDYYGNCRNADRYAGLPLLALAGDADTWGPPAMTCAAFGESIPPGSDFTLQTYKGAVHGFDNAAQVTRRFNEGHPLQYDPDAAADSFIRARALLERTIGPAR